MRSRQFWQPVPVAFAGVAMQVRGGSDTPPTSAGAAWQGHA